MGGVTSTLFGDHVLRKAENDRGLARMQYRYFRDERQRCRCAWGCPGCAELERVLFGLESMWGRKDQDDASRAVPVQAVTGPDLRSELR